MALAGCDANSWIRCLHTAGAAQAPAEARAACRAEADGIARILRFPACKFGASVACDRHTANGGLRAVPRAGSFGRFIAWQANADIGWHPTPQAP